MIRNSNLLTQLLCFANRNLQITANLPPSWNGCELLLLLNIPAGAYINPYELEADGEAPFHFENLPVDIEQTAEDSTPNSLKLLTKLDCHEVCQYLVTLPTHLRYHSPRTSDSVYVRVPFSPGTITKSCPGSKEPTKYTITFGKGQFWVPTGNLSHSSFVFFTTATTTMAGTLILLYRIMKPMSPS